MPFFCRADVHAQPRLFSIINDDNVGVEAVFVGEQLTLRVRSGSSGGKEEDAVFNARFALERWYHVVVTHQYHMLGKSSATLFVDGQRDSVVPLVRWFKFTPRQL